VCTSGNGSVKGRKELTQECIRNRRVGGYGVNTHFSLKLGEECQKGWGTLPIKITSGKDTVYP